MSANVETMMYTGDVPWHGEGVALTEAPTSQEAIVAAGLDWTVSPNAVYTVDANGNSVLVPDTFANMRSSDSKILGVVGKVYEPLQNREAFDFTDSIIGEGLARYHTAGALDGGRRIFLSIKLDSTMRVKQDLIEKFLVCASSHDGSLATMALVTPVRVVCQNTLAQAFGNCSNKIAVRHTKAQGEKLKLAQKTLAQALGYFEKFEAMANALTSVKVDDQTFDKIVKVVMPAKDENDVPTRTVNLRNTLRHLFQGGAKGSDGHLGTGWQAYNALTEYADHHRLVKGENEVVNSRLFGTAASFKEKALTTLLSAVQLPMAA